MTATSQKGRHLSCFSVTWVRPVVTITRNYGFGHYLNRLKKRVIR